VDSAGARAAITAVATDFAELPDDTTLTGDGPLGWAGYAEERARATERSGEDESVVCGPGTVGGVGVVLIAFDFRHLGGSVGSRAGARIESAFTYARVTRRPVVSLIATGGSRMQEGMLSLVQLQRIAAQAARTRAAGVPHLSVLRDPTTGGLWASLGAGADVVLGIAGAQVGFAGRRVRPAADVDDPAYTSEGKYASGHVDEVVDLVELPQVLEAWLALLRPAPELPTAATATTATTAPAKTPRALGASDAPADGWTAVQGARSDRRPRAAAYLADHFDSYRLISGDRAGGTDPGMLCGIGLRDGRPVAFAAQAGTATTPAGFRTAARLIHLADRFGLPVLTLVDTPGASNDAAAERAGVGPSIAGLFDAVACAAVPITTLVIGEGGSGGALALAAPDNTWVTPDAYFVVTAPELAAAILKRSPSDVPATADALRVRPQDLVELGVVRGISY
jgi:acetyl-CoA carboxylase carboxyl transferase subunit beta